MYEDFQNKLNIILVNRFQKDLLEAAILNLKSDNNLSFNNFAYSLRELSRHFLKSLSPDELIKESSWFKNETKIEGKYSRGERVKYSIQGGLEDRFVEREIMSLNELNSTKKKVLDSIEILNKYTHINQDTFALKEDLKKSNSQEIMNSFMELTETISTTRRTIIKSLEEKLSNRIFEKAMWEVNDDVDILATHHWIEDVRIDEYNIVKLESRKILIDVQGSMDFLLQWGSDGDIRRGDGHQMNENFPFNATFSIQLSKRLKNSDAQLVNYDIDTSGWYE